MEAIKQLTNDGIVVSLGHTSSDMETSIRAVQNGATFITHLFNAMLSVCTNALMYGKIIINTVCIYSFITEILGCLV